MACIEKKRDTKKGRKEKKRKNEKKREKVKQVKNKACIVVQQYAIGTYYLA